MTENLQWTKRLNQEKVDSAYLKIFGQKYTEYRYLWNKSGNDFLPDFPIHLDMEVIDSCNLSCGYCFRDREVASTMGIDINTGVKFPVQEYKDILSEGKKYGLKSINLGFSGECLMRDDICELIETARSYDVLDIRIITNATLLNKDMVDRLIETPLTLFSISVDAGSPETYKSLKGRDYFGHLEDIIKYLYARKKELKKEFPLVRASYYISPKNSFEQKMFLEEFQDYVDFIDFQEFKDLKKLKKHDMRVDCLMPFRRLSIFANGDVAPCCSFFSKKLIVGNINNMSLKEIWDSEIVNGIRKNLIERKPMAVCEECLQSVG